MKEFLIFKAKEKNNDKSPDYNISAKVGDKFVNIGAGWNRKTKGNPPIGFISCKLSNQFKDRKGWRLTPDEQEVENLWPKDGEKKEPTKEEEFIAM